MSEIGQLPGRARVWFADSVLLVRMQEARDPVCTGPVPRVTDREQRDNLPVVLPDDQGQPVALARPEIVVEALLRALVPQQPLLRLLDVLGPEPGVIGRGAVIIEPQFQGV